MPITATPVSPVIITKDQIRMFLRDKAENNILLDGVEFTDKDLDLASTMAADAFNAVTPVSSFTPSNFPNRYVLMIGTARWLMMSESFLQVRNQATEQDGDIAPIGIFDKVQQYAQLAAQLKGEWDELVRGIKTQANMEGAYNSLGSGYMNVSRFNHS